MLDNEKRVYKRSDHFQCAAIANNNVTGKSENVDVIELSSGGLSFVTKMDLKRDDILNIAVTVEGFFTEFVLNTRIKIKRVAQEDEDTFVCGASFFELSPEQAIRLDESVKYDRPLQGGSYSSD